MEKLELSKSKVFNQGTIVATNFTVVDYLADACGLEFVSGFGRNPGWIYNSNSKIASFEYDETILQPGESVILTIDLRILDCSIEPNFDYTNFAEISEYDDDFNQFNSSIPDIDSDPDDTNYDDAGGQVRSQTDNSIDGDGTGVFGSGLAENDEDDHDPAMVELFDLALYKELVSTGPFNYYDVVEFKIIVCNQGNIGAQNIVIGDYLPSGYSFDFGNNPNWSGTIASPTYNISDVLEVNDCIGIPIFLTVEQTTGGEKDWVNYAEILSAENENGDDRTGFDIDSTPGSDNAVENDVEPGDAEDDYIDGRDKGGEEDDHDPAGIEIYDLALTKTILSGGMNSYGEVVTFEITVINQGSIASNNIEITDYIPCGFKYLSSNDASGWNYDMTTGKAKVTLDGCTLLQGKVLR